MILVVCAVARELQMWTPPRHVEMLVTGVGPVEAAACLSRALAQSTYDLVVNGGIAGAIDPAYEIGSAVVVGEEMLELGLEDGSPIALPDNLRVVDRVRSDIALCDRMAERGFPVVRGVTVARVTSTNASADRLRQTGSQVETMEGFSVLRAAEIAGVPAIELRGISNLVGDRPASGWNFSAGAAATVTALRALLSMLGYSDG